LRAPPSVRATMQHAATAAHAHHRATRTCLHGHPSAPSPPRPEVEEDDVDNISLFNHCFVLFRHFICSVSTFHFVLFQYFV
jgi:hypothetical protein